ncbi:hypothetical protein IW140_003836 [Coemansia sp. RSA 1813]|nr:hypothetical protein EV178_001687 [Coemansia sp. RSA 1646]KAJ1765168.1 hypothetical protein LPJ74_006461 [Coemansia sp. RSA 1843]KAJ2090076.1 hypothetical protein IW138_002886 [Coemansia sp. RSA 986]KAJ2211419.1 hypothetical protein EV179_005511 [Coemansia sp. RSA 487]KAJ2568518.1 hypothetical protein IW140_003836 [Coemansia sp. RSA 1813]
MRLPFSLHRSTKSTENFVQLLPEHDGNAAPNKAIGSGGGGGPLNTTPLSAGRNRGMSASSVASNSSILVGSRPAANVQYARGRPISMVHSAYGHSPSAELQLAQIEEELDTIMDEMGIQPEQRMTMKNMPVDNKVRLIQTHKLRATKDTRTDATPLSEHLKILERAGTQSLPLVRLEKLRVDISYQSIQQTNAFIDDGGLRLLLIHLAQLNGRRTANRRIDELNKENEILRCVLGLAKVSAGASFLVEGTSVHLRHILDSAGSVWLPCAVMALRIGSYLVQQESLYCVATVLSSMFRRDTTSESTAKRNPPFVEWMEAIDHAVKEYTGKGSTSSASSSPGSQRQTAFQPSQHGNRATIVDFISSSLMFINSIVDALSSNIDRRIKFYDRINAHNMFVTFASLRQWNTAIITSHLNRWDEALRRDYNLSRSQRTDAIVLDNGADSSIRDFSLFKSFVAQYEAARAEAATTNDATFGDSQNNTFDGSDNEDEYLRMDLSMYASGPGTHGAKHPVDVAHETVSAPATPRFVQNSDGAGGSTTAATNPVNTPSGSHLPPSNPFYTTRNARAASTNKDSHIMPPFATHGRSHSSNVAETGNLRDLRPAASAVLSDHDDNVATVPSNTSVLATIGNAHELLKSAFAEIPILAAAADENNGVDDARRDLLAVVDLAQSMLCVLEQKS